MFQKKSTVGFIPARGGSKGVPGKNIKKIAGKPLIAWSIEQAIESNEISEVYVSTDSEEIAEVALTYGAKVPFLRPVELATDQATTESAMLHFCDFMGASGIQCENILLIQATSPVRAFGRFDDAILRFQERRLDSLVAVSPSHRFFWSNIASPKADYNFNNRPRRQDIDPSEQKYMETGSFYLTKVDCFLAFKNRLCGKVGLYITPEREMYEIDSQLDFKICETILLDESRG